MTVSLFIWQSEVKDSELDAQAIVNNAVYFTYLEHTRHKYRPPSSEVQHSVESSYAASHGVLSTG
ncbi:hypothetical protein Psal073_01594 [Piscirickettsia salmonis]|uniref:acyl-CoA thioesterase n=1 Tax=Piscirickettsia salmonis TaxID=1238 RepID=UPI0012B78409|nr:hypothetical protein [Piscirickettsia salmonis]QGO66637.1 hypothetical protein Psal073_01594 [Piscirickettsia salmonis]